MAAVDSIVSDASQPSKQLAIEELQKPTTEDQVVIEQRSPEACPPRSASLQTWGAPLLKCKAFRDIEPDGLNNIGQQYVPVLPTTREVCYAKGTERQPLCPEP